jgi:hypothetical protein
MARRGGATGRAAMEAAEGVATPESEAAEARVHTPEGSNSREW